MKKILLTIIACLFLFEGQALAHTGLESSNPANGSTITEQLKEISLSYETKIEKTSSFELIDSKKKEHPISNLTVSETSMTGSIEQALPNGDYTIVWKIIGADGHLITGEVSFTQNAPIMEDKKEEVNIPVAETTDIATNETTSDKEDESSNTVLIAIIVALVAVLGASMWFMMRRKEK